MYLPSGYNSAMGMVGGLVCFLAPPFFFFPLLGEASFTDKAWTLSAAFVTSGASPATSESAGKKSK